MDHQSIDGVTWLSSQCDQGPQIAILTLLQISYVCNSKSFYEVCFIFLNVVCFHLGSDNLLQLEIKKWKDLHEQDLEKIENMKQEYNCMAKEVCSKLLANIY